MEGSTKAEGSGGSTVRALILGTIAVIISTYWVVGAENRIIYELTDFSISLFWK